MIRRVLGVMLLAGVSVGLAFAVARARGGVISASAQTAAAQTASPTANTSDKAWIARSNEFANLLIDIEKKHTPERASADGLSQYDELISVATHEDDEAEAAENRAALAKLQEQFRDCVVCWTIRWWRSGVLPRWSGCASTPGLSRASRR